MFVDSHCHLSFPELLPQLPQIQAAMRAAHVEQALCICTTLEEFDTVHHLASSHHNLWCTAGVHPDNEGVQEPTVERLLDLAKRPRVVGIGETGLDYYRLGTRSVGEMAWQRDRFAVHIAASRQSRLPLVVHTRNASEDTVSMLKEGGAAPHEGGAGGVFHCFTETMQVAKAALDLGFYISFSGILTFRNAQALRDVARYVPLERCLIETDSPYLAPVPHRGKLNTPAHVPLVAQALASEKGLGLEAVAQATAHNFRSLFAVAQPVPKPV